MIMLDMISSGTSGSVLVDGVEDHKKKKKKKTGISLRHTYVSQCTE